MKSCMCAHARDPVAALRLRHTHSLTMHPSGERSIGMRMKFVALLAAIARRQWLGVGRQRPSGGDNHSVTGSGGMTSAT